MDEKINIKLTKQELSLVKKGLTTYSTILRQNQDHYNDKINMVYDLNERLSSIQIENINNNCNTDYFLLIIDNLLNDTDDDFMKYITKEVYDLFINDIYEYRIYSIRQYNNDISRATDTFCVKKFLNEYSVAIRVFNLHIEFDRRKFNILINSAWEIIRNNE